MELSGKTVRKLNSSSIGVVIIMLLLPKYMGLNAILIKIPSQFFMELDELNK